MAKMPSFGLMFTAWQWAPMVRGDRVVWVVEKNAGPVGGRIVAWRLEQEFDTKAAAMDMAGSLNNGADTSAVRMRRVTDDEPPPPRLRSLRGSPWQKAPPPHQAVVTGAPVVGGGRAEKAQAQPVAGVGDADRLRAALEACGGVWVFTGLYRGGERVPASLSSTMSGPFWRLRESIAGRWHVPSGPTSRIQREMGLREADETARGVLRTRREKQPDGSVRMRSWVARAGCKWGTDAKHSPAKGAV